MTYSDCAKQNKDHRILLPFSTTINLVQYLYKYYKFNLFLSLCITLCVIYLRLSSINTFLRIKNVNG